MGKVMSQAAYARHRAKRGLPGATPGAVAAAIRWGRLAKSLTDDRPRQIRSAKAADAEWAAATNADRVPLTGPTAPATGDASAPVNELAAARARREAAAAELAEIDLAERRGSLVRAHDLEARLADVFLRSRTRLLGLPSRLREQDPTLTAAQLELVEALLVEALEELAGGEEGSA